MWMRLRTPGNGDSVGAGDAAAEAEAEELAGGSGSEEAGEGVEAADDVAAAMAALWQPLPAAAPAAARGQQAATQAGGGVTRDVPPLL
jgi:hypothetical protein